MEITYNLLEDTGVVECSFVRPDGWRIVGFLDSDETGRLTLRGLCLLPATDLVSVVQNGPIPGAGVSAALWRSVPVGRITDGATAKHAEYLAASQRRDERDEEEIDFERQAKEREWQEAWSTKRGPTGHPDKLYAELAVRFIAHVTGGSRAPLDRLAKVNGWNRATTARRIREARARGLLTNPSRGSVGGELTPRAVELTGKFIGTEATWQAIQLAERATNKEKADGKRSR